MFLLCNAENRIRQPAAERLVVLELFEELGVVGEECGDDALERFVVLDLGVLAVSLLRLAGERWFGDGEVKFAIFHFRVAGGWAWGVGCGRVPDCIQ